MSYKTIPWTIHSVSLFEKYRRWSAKQTPSLLAGLVFLGGGAAFIGNAPIEGYSSTLFGLFLMLAAIVTHLESTNNQQAERVRLLEEAGQRGGGSEPY
ncbi:hypothetical protein [Saliphagus infecundisoli]|uniref:YiaAB two helix domain-containing protein n=1 Tax=Saliphagus infecundisoli TaxID=1849069 RepID=A0ABD5QBL6_9EURY|nr:hypothetical protein [Saliphagus infecundisoli]